MKTRSILSILFIIILSACGTSETDDNSTPSDEVEVIQPNVEVNFENEPLPIGEETPIQAIVTGNEEPITDADYVEFEIWSEAEGEEQSETLEAKHTEEGVYEIMYTFKASGTYQVIAHTQARNVHTMPQTEVQVGPKDEDEDQHEHGENSTDSDSGEFTVHMVTNKDFVATEESKLTTHIEQKKAPFENAEVKFEISSDQLDKHEFIEASEEQAGQYSTTFEFPSPGKYMVNVHYEKPDEDIHGHKEQPVEVVE
ncbi:FixH family protein [Halobacillus seohaensis]|uniref:FixH family protein n=1 Tax=Halobacillus seohaensis TaxID=447421 RepID=A0ABW2ESF1_9BACI